MSHVMTALETSVISL